MTGYMLVEQKDLRKPDGIQANEQKIGALDFLRELAADEFPFPRLARLRVHGLEEVLFAAGDDARDIALEIRRRLKSVANDMDQKLISVQFVFREPLERGNDLWVTYGGRRLPIGLIFGSAPPQTAADGSKYYHCGASLTNGY